MCMCSGKAEVSSLKAPSTSLETGFSVLELANHTRLADFWSPEILSPLPLQGWDCRHVLFHLASGALNSGPVLSREVLFQWCHPLSSWSFQFLAQTLTSYDKKVLRESCFSRYTLREHWCIFTCVFMFCGYIYTFIIIHRAFWGLFQDPSLKIPRSEDA